MSFYTDVIARSPKFHTSDRVSDMDLLEPVTRAAVQRIIVQAASSGVKLTVFESYRSQERQAEMYRQGASQLKTVGVHHFGLACDLVKDVGGEPSWKGDFSFLGPLARANGLIWGGDWGHPGVPTKFPDADHVQRCRVEMQAQLFALTWYPDASYNPWA